MLCIGKLSEILNIKDEIKVILTDLGVITDTTTFEEYPAIIEQLVVK